MLSYNSASFNEERNKVNEITQKTKGSLKESRASVSLKIINNVYLTVFKPNVCSGQFKNEEETQTVLIKGKLGQFKVMWPWPQAKQNILRRSLVRSIAWEGKPGRMSVNPSEDCGALGEKTGERAQKREDCKAKGAWGNEINAGTGQQLRGGGQENGGWQWSLNLLYNSGPAWTVQKEKKHFVYNLASKTIEDKYFLSPTPNSFREWPSERGLNLAYAAGEAKYKQPTQAKEAVKAWANRLMISCEAETINRTGAEREVTEAGEDEGFKRQAAEERPGGQTKARSVNGVASENLAKQLKNMMTGVTQGYTKNLELRGIGYQGKIIELPEINERGVRSSGASDQNLSWGVSTQGGVLRPSSEWAELGAGGKAKPKNRASEGLRFYNEAKLKGKASNYKGPNWGQVENKIIKGFWERAQAESTGESEESEGFGKMETEPRKMVTERPYLILNLGASHQIKYPIPEQQVSINVLQTNTISIFGISSFKVNQTAAEIYRFKNPEPYKGKGIRYDGEKFFEKPKQRNQK